MVLRGLAEDPVVLGGTWRGAVVVLWLCVVMNMACWVWWCGDCGLWWCVVVMRGGGAVRGGGAWSGWCALVSSMVVQW